LRIGAFFPSDVSFDSLASAATFYKSLLTKEIHSYDNNMLEVFVFPYVCNKW